MEKDNNYNTNTHNWITSLIKKTQKQITKDEWEQWFIFGVVPEGTKKKIKELEKGKNWGINNVARK